MDGAFKSGETETLQAALRELFAADPDLAHAREVAGALPDRRRPEGFASLTMLIVEQQVSIASARAIWGRIEGGLGEVTAERVGACSDDELRAFGLSRPKVRYCRALADVVLAGDFSFDDLAGLDDDAAMARLMALKGIGRWTAEVYLLFALGRGDIFPAGDVALQAAAQDVKKLQARPTTDELYGIADLWRPHRGIAAQLLWRYYGVTRGRADPVSVSALR